MTPSLLLPTTQGKVIFNSRLPKGYCRGICCITANGHHLARHLGGESPSSSQLGPELRYVHPYKLTPPGSPAPPEGAGAPTGAALRTQRTRCLAKSSFALFSFQINLS